MFAHRPRAGLRTALFILCAGCLPAAATDLDVGRTYSGMIDVGAMGSRKQFILPAAQGEWTMLHEDDYRPTLTGFNPATQINTKMTDYLWGDLKAGQAHALLHVRASMHKAEDVIWPDTCKTAPDNVYRNRFADYSTAVREKCLLVDQQPGGALSATEMKALGKFAPDSLNARPLRARFTISHRRHGFLEITVTALTGDTGIDETRRRAFIDWSERYADQLEDALSHSLDFRPLPPVPALSAASVQALVEPRQSTPRAAAKTGADEILTLIEKLRELRDKGSISDDEFNRKKQELLQRL